jgi:Protein of unknown function (DUF4238)
MAGDRQHFLPRFLLKGFASRRKGKDAYTWVFPHDSLPFETNIMNIGVSKKFYNLAEDNHQLDDMITDIENTFANFIDDLRSRTSDTELLNPEIPGLVTHMMLRTKYLRDSFYSSANYLFDALLLAIKQPEFFEKAILNRLKTHPEEFWNNMPGTQYLTTTQKAVFMNHVVNLTPALLRTQQPQIAMMADSIKQHISANLERLAKDSHVKSLTKNLLPEARVNFARGLDWFLVIRGKGALILGDVGVVSKIEPKGRLKPLPDVSDEVRQIWLPISDTHLVTGLKTKSEMGELNIEVINRGTSSLSHDFFISSKNSQYESRFAECLGTESGIISDEELEKIVQEVLESLLGN